MLKSNFGAALYISDPAEKKVVIRRPDHYFYEF